MNRLSNELRSSIATWLRHATGNIYGSGSKGIFILGNRKRWIGDAGAIEELKFQLAKYDELVNEGKVLLASVAAVQLATALKETGSENHSNQS